LNFSRAIAPSDASTSLRNSSAGDHRLRRPLAESPRAPRRGGPPVRERREEAARRVEDADDASQHVLDDVLLAAQRSQREPRVVERLEEEKRC
jgi:hypothetical protein